MKQEIRNEDPRQYGDTTPPVVFPPVERRSTGELLAMLGVQPETPYGESVRSARKRLKGRHEQLDAAFEIVQRWHEEKLRADPMEFGNTNMPGMGGPKAVKEYLAMHLAGHDNERFMVMFLDARYRLLTCETMFMGTVTSSDVHPRPIVQRALELNAAVLILAHNHPSGVAEASSSDKAMTETLSKCMSLFDLKVLDHIIVGDGEVMSFVEQGLL